MYVARVPNRNSPPAYLLREGYREDGKVKSRLPPIVPGLLGPGGPSS
jgi:hypothetical protein